MSSERRVVVGLELISLDRVVERQQTETGKENGSVAASHPLRLTTDVLKTTDYCPTSSATLEQSPPVIAARFIIESLITQGRRPSLREIQKIQIPAPIQDGVSWSWTGRRICLGIFVGPQTGIPAESFLHVSECREEALSVTATFFRCSLG